jgi:hypothetical protein
MVERCDGMGRMVSIGLTRHSGKHILYGLSR